MENNICTIDELKKFTKFSTKEERKLKKIVKRHPMQITPYYLSLIDWNNSDDPIKKMAIPSTEEPGCRPGSFAFYMSHLRPALRWAWKPWK